MANAVLQTEWFDGRSPRARPVQVWLEGAELVLCAEGVAPRRCPVDAVRWPERRSHGQRQAELPDGGLLQHSDPGEWDRWWLSSGQQESRVVGWMQSWRATLVSLLGTVAVLAAAWVWGVPWLSVMLAHMVPDRLEQRIGEQSLQQIERLFLKPSALSQAEQDALRRRFAAAVARRYAGGGAPQWHLGFHSSKLLGANAFALPGGHMVITDDLVRMLADEPDALVGILGHELGHVERRHGLDLMVRASLVSALVGVVLGDASGFLATVPATLATQSYSRDAEREADADAARLLHASGISPAVMVAFFERIVVGPGSEGSREAHTKEDAKDSGISSLPISIASHPDHAERILFFSNWTPSGLP